MLFFSILIMFVVFFVLLNLVNLLMDAAGNLEMNFDASIWAYFSLMGAAYLSAYVYKNIK